MSNLEVLKYEQASDKAKEIFDMLKKKIGKVPNIYAAMANSPYALKAHLLNKEMLGQGEFNSIEIETIALTTAEQNQCGYCLAAHTVIGRMAGLSEEQTLRIRRGESEDPKLKALILLTREIVASQGRPNQRTIDAFYEAGYSNAALAELIGQVALNIFTNYFNHIAGTPIDFREAKRLSVKVLSQ